jgi:hypothetical protein
MKAKTILKAMFTVLLISVVLGSNTLMPVSAADKSAVEAFVTRFYQLCLDRNPDSNGLDDWVTSLLDGTQTGSDVADGFVFSNEFIAKNLSNEDFLRVLYKAFFNRNADNNGWNLWLSALTSGSSRKEVLDGFIFADEFAALCDQFGIDAYEDNTSKSQREQIEAFVTRFYQLCLDRNPDPAGLAAWVDSLLNGSNTGADVADGFINSTEFIAKGSTNTEFLEILYEAFFDRKPDSTGWDIWFTALEEGRHPKEVLDGFIYSNEFSELCQLFGIKGYDSLPPPVSSDNSKFYGAYLTDAKTGACPADTIVVTIGSDQSREDEGTYIYLPEKGTTFSYSSYNQYGDLLKTNYTVSEYSITIHEEEFRTDGSKETVDIVIRFDANYESLTISGIEIDNRTDPGDCKGTISGSGYRIQFTGPYDGIWSGQFDTTMSSCERGMLTMVITNSQVIGIAIDTDDDEYDISGTVSADGTLNGGIYDGGQLGATITGKLSSNSGNGTYDAVDEGCQGTWTVTKQ